MPWNAADLSTLRTAVHLAIQSEERYKQTVEEPKARAAADANIRAFRRLLRRMDRKEPL